MKRNAHGLWIHAGIVTIAVVVGASGCDNLRSPKPPAQAPPPTAEEAAAKSSVTLMPPKAAETQIVARVNDQLITLQDFRQRTEELKAFDVDWKTLSPADKETLRSQLLEDLVRTELMARDSVARGTLREPDTQATLWYLLRAFLARSWVQREQKAIRVTQPDIETFYNAQKELYKVPAKMRVRDIAVRTEADAKQLLQQLLGGASFTELAKSRSIAPNAASGGERGFIVRERDKQLYGRIGQELEGATLFPAAEDVVFALEEGGISQIVKGPGVSGAPEAYYIFMVSQKQPSRDKSLTEVQDEVKALLTLQKLNEKVGQLRHGAKVDLYQDKLKDE